MTEIQAAIGRLQLRKLYVWVGINVHLAGNAQKRLVSRPHHGRGGSCSEIYLEKAFDLFRKMDSAATRRMTAGGYLCGLEALRGILGFLAALQGVAGSETFWLSMGGS